VQLISIKVIPDRLHDFYQLEQSLSEYCSDSLTGLLAK